MQKNIRLVDLLAFALNDLNTSEKKAFRVELNKELPGFIRKTARAVKAEHDPKDK